MVSFKEILAETTNTLAGSDDAESINGNSENYNIQDILEVLTSLDQDELNAVGDMIMDLVYDPEFDAEDIEDYNESELSEEELNEVKYFKTKSKELARARKRDRAGLIKQKKLRKRYYKKNKAKLKRKNKKYRKKVKRNPNIVRKHRK